jgi:hypothetical protein
MSYGKLVLKLEILDASTTGDEDNVFSKPARKVTMLTRHSVTKSDAFDLVNAFADTNLVDKQRHLVEAYWYPEPVRIDLY